MSNGSNQATTRAERNGTSERPPRPSVLTVNKDKISQPLMELSQWVAWRLTWREARKKWDKPPVNVRSGKWAKTTDPETWATFEEAFSAYHEDEDLDGIGLVLAKHTGLVGIDLDHCINPETREIEAWAREIIVSIASYTEVSPSGEGIRIIAYGRVPPGGNKKDKIEIYDHSRYVTITGQHVEGTPEEVRESQAAIDRLHQQVFGKVRKPQHQPRPSAAISPEIEQLIEQAKTENPRFAKLWKGDAGDYPSASEADLALCSMLSRMVGADRERIEQFFPLSGLCRDKWDRDDYRTRTIDKAINDDRPEIILSTEEHLVNDQAVAALARDPDIYQRAGRLVQIVKTPRPKREEIHRDPDSPRIMILPDALVREKLAAAVRFRVWKKGRLQSAHPSPWVVDAVASRGHWLGIRYLEGVVDFPVLRPDGSIFQQRGYDEVTRLLYVPSGEVPPISNKPTFEEIEQARDLLLDVVCDFPFAGDAHRATFLALLLTPLARYAFDGPAPLFLVDANTPGCGKGLLCNVVSLIVSGKAMAVMPQPGSDDECRKRITSIALAGDRLVLIDNVSGSFGCPSLDAALTSSIWHDRLLGRSEVVQLPMQTVWMATGNNVLLDANIYRRVCHIRLQSPLERPEDRGGFRYPELKRHVLEYRSKLLTAALTILRGYIAHGCPDQKLKPWGSFEGWSQLIRNAVVWSGLADPSEARLELRQQADLELSALTGVIAGIEYLGCHGRGLPASEILARISTAADARSVALREGLCSLCHTRGYDLPSAQILGIRLAHFRGRVIGGKYLERSLRNHTAVWHVITSGEGQPAESIAAAAPEIRRRPVNRRHPPPPE